VIERKIEREKERRAMSMIKKTLAFLGTVTATGLAGAATLALAYAPQAQGARDRLRGVYDDLRRRLRGEATPEASTSEEQKTEAVRATEHALDHGPDARARAIERSRKPHVSSTVPEASVHPFRARRHA
jgi:hypothetical protein